jgi:glutamine---fructose-6-phosphate transaminase (isomerizing)
MSAEHRMLRDIRDQPESLAGVLAYQSGAGRAALEDAASVLRNANRTQSLAGVLAYQSGAGRAVLEEAASVLRNARRIVVTGMGASLNAAMLLDYHLRAQGLPSGAIEASELLHFGGSLAADSVVVLVSRSGETVEAVRLLPKLRDVGARVIGITNMPVTSIAME